MPTPLENLKVQMNIVDDADDAFLTLVLGVATEWVAEMVGGEQDNPPAPVAHAIRMLAAHLFENREAVLVGVTAQEMPLGVMTLLDPYRVWFAGEEC